MLTKSQAMALVAEVMATFAHLQLRDAEQAELRQSIWADLLCEVKLLEMVDVRIALRAIAKTEHEGYWRLEVAELLEQSKIEMRRRRQKEEQAEGLKRQALSANTTTPVDPVRGKIIRDVWLDVAMKRLGEPEAEMEIARRLKMSEVEVTARRELLEQQRRGAA